MVEPVCEAAKGEILEWNPEWLRAIIHLIAGLMPAPAPGGLPGLEKAFETHERHHIALGVLAEHSTSWKRPVGYFSRQQRNPWTKYVKGGCHIYEQRQKWCCSYRRHET